MVFEAVLCRIDFLLLLLLFPLTTRLRSANIIRTVRLLLNNNMYYCVRHTMLREKERATERWYTRHNIPLLYCVRSRGCAATLLVHHARRAIQCKIIYLRTEDGPHPVSTSAITVTEYIHDKRTNDRIHWRLFSSFSLFPFFSSSSVRHAFSRTRFRWCRKHYAERSAIEHVRK